MGVFAPHLHAFALAFHPLTALIAAIGGLSNTFGGTCIALGIELFGFFVHPFALFLNRRGLPIGNLTSQFWANVYLDAFDHFVKDDCGVKGYIRFVDDFLLFAEDKPTLHDLEERCREKLASLRLLLHPRKTRVYPVSEGIPFIGFRVWPTHRRLLPGSVKRARRRLAQLETMAEAVPCIRAWIAHAAHGDTYGLRRTLLAPVVIARTDARVMEVDLGTAAEPPAINARGRDGAE